MARLAHLFLSLSHLCQACHLLSARCVETSFRDGTRWEIPAIKPGDFEDVFLKIEPSRGKQGRSGVQNNSEEDKGLDPMNMEGATSSARGILTSLGLLREQK